MEVEREMKKIVLEVKKKKNHCKSKRNGIVFNLGWH